MATTTINNLRLLPINSKRDKFQVKNPQGVILEEFTTEAAAQQFMYDTKDYVKLRVSNKTHKYRLLEKVTHNGRPASVSTRDFSANKRPVYTLLYTDTPAGIGSFIPGKGQERLSGKVDEVTITTDKS